MNTTISTDQKPNNKVYYSTCDMFTQNLLESIIKNGSKDINPRPHWKDGTPAHTYSINHVTHMYWLQVQSPFLTLRYTAIKKAIGEILWIYQDQSNDLDLLKEKYGITWWDAWDIGNRTIGSCYGETVRRHDLMNYLLTNLKENPDSRYHIINLWQVEDFKDKHGLKPCCYQTVWNVTHEKDGDYLDMCLFQRSSDFTVSGNINTLQYVALLYMVAGHCGYKVGKFTHYIANAQIYDRHIEQAKELIRRTPALTLGHFPHFEVEPKNFYDYTVDDIKIIDYDKELIEAVNPQLYFEIAI